MITITKGQRVADYPNLFVVSPSGTYNEEDLIVCAEDDMPGTPSCMFQAQLVAFGNIVYSSAEPITPAQKEEIAAEQARIAEESAPDQGRIIEPDSLTPAQPASPVEPSPLPEEAPAPSMEIVTDEASATQNMSTTTPATTTTDIVPEPDAAPAASSSPDAGTTTQDVPTETP
jgi:hypothetical protein